MSHSFHIAYIIKYSGFK